MRIGVVGLGRMGGAIAKRLMRAGHECVVFDQAPSAARDLVVEGARAARDTADLVKRLPPPRHIWLMLPAGPITEGAIEDLVRQLQPGDTLIDGGNTFYRDDIVRAKRLDDLGIHYLDAGTSGGVWGLERGFCLMVGGETAAFEAAEPIFSALAPGIGDIPRTKGASAASTRAERGYIHAGAPGAGHFVKMVHNGIEYGLMQAYAEGFDLLRAQRGAETDGGAAYDLDLADVAEVWRRGSVVGSWLLDLIAVGLAEDGELETFSGVVADTGEGRWTLEAAIERSTPMPALAAALFARFRSRQDHTFADKLLSAMRMGFGGHKELAGQTARKE